MWLCVQNGAREHYAIPRALNQSGRLEMLFTEMWAGRWLRQLAFGPLRAAAGRWHEDLEPKAESGKRKTEIIAWNFESVGRQLASTIRNRKSQIANPHARFIREGQWFSEKVRNYLAKRSTDLLGKIIFSYDTTALELFEWARDRGAVCVLGQMDPGRVETELVREEEQRWPGWARTENSEMLKAETLTTIGDGQSAVGGDAHLEAYYRRREAEWKLADRIVVNSHWSFDALVNQGVPREKLVVVPLCYEVEVKTQKSELRSRKADAALRVLFLGQVILRKGIQYLVEAAKLLKDEPVVFDIVGPIGIAEQIIKSVPTNMTFHGRIERTETSKWYDLCDVMVLPTISDGFAITQIEAMTHGLPVIATPHCGEVVTDEVDGFIVPARDAEALAKAIRKYLTEPSLLATQSIMARKKSGQFSLSRLAENLNALEKTLRRK